MNDEMIKEPYLFDKDEGLKEIKRLRDWGKYYENLYEKFKKPKHQEKINKIIRKIVMIGLGLSEADLKSMLEKSTSETEEQIFKRLGELQDDWDKEGIAHDHEFIETGTRNVNREIVRPKPFLKPIIDDIVSEIKIQSTDKALIKALKDLGHDYKALKKNRIAPLDTGQLKRNITGKKDQIGESLKQIGKTVGVDYDPKGLRKKMKDCYNKLTPEQKKAFEMMYQSLKPAGDEDKDG